MASTNFLPQLTIVVRLKGETQTGQQAGGPEAVLRPISEIRALRKPNA